MRLAYAAVVGVLVGMVIGFFVTEVRSRRKIGELSVRAAVAEERETAARRNDEAMRETFKSLAVDALTVVKSAWEGDEEKKEVAVRALVDPLSESIREFRLFMETQARTTREEYGALGQQAKMLQRDLGTLNETLGSNQTAGTWGESQLRNLVTYAGMMEHVDFIEQHTVTDSSRIRRPDMVVRLASGARIPIDSKVSLDAYRHAVEEVDRSLRESLLKQHSLNMRRQVDELAKKEYQSAIDGSFDFVVMFVPVEAAAADAFRFEPTLYDYAMRKGIIFATPSTLLVLLKSAQFGWQEHLQIESAREIGQQAQQIYEALVTMFKHLSEVGTSIKRSAENYNKVVGSFERNISPKSRRLEKLVSSQRPLPPLEEIHEDPRTPRGLSIPRGESVDQAFELDVEDVVLEAPEELDPLSE